MEVCQPRTYTSDYREQGLLVITLYLCAWCPCTPYVVMVVGGEQLSLHNTNGLVDTHTNTCTQIKSAMPTPIELSSVPVPN